MKLNYKGCNEREKIVKAIFGVRRTMEPGEMGRTGIRVKFKIPREMEEIIVLTSHKSKFRLS